MFSSTSTDVDQQVVESLAKKWNVDLEAEEVAGATATFAGIETAARQIGDRVTRLVCEDLALRQVQLLSGPQSCPTCGKLADSQTKNRWLTLGDGQKIDLPEVVCHCSACRRDFFPSACPFGPAPTRL